MTPAIAPLSFIELVLVFIFLFGAVIAYLEHAARKRATVVRQPTRGMKWLRLTLFFLAIIIAWALHLERKQKRDIAEDLLRAGILYKGEIVYANMRRYESEIRLEDGRTVRVDDYRHTGEKVTVLCLKGRDDCEIQEIALKRVRNWPLPATNQLENFLGGIMLALVVVAILIMLLPKLLAISLRRKNARQSKKSTPSAEPPLAPTATTVTGLGQYYRCCRTPEPGVSFTLAPYLNFDLDLRRCGPCGHFTLELSWYEPEAHVPSKAYIPVPAHEAEEMLSFHREREQGARRDEYFKRWLERRLA